MKIRGARPHHSSSRPVFSLFRRFAVMSAFASSLVSCNPDVVIGTRWGEWCATAPIGNAPVVFADEQGNLVIPPGRYDVTYVSGAQIHDPSIGYEVTDHYYGQESLQAGHHLFSGERPESSATHLWLRDEGLVSGGTIEDVESANRGHTWSLDHDGGELYVTLYDDLVDDNSGPGSTFCVRSRPRAP